MSNLTIVVDDGVLKRARKRAIDQGTSVNAVLRDYLHSYAGDSQSTRAAKEFLHLSEGSPADSGPAGRSWTRDELYDNADRHEIG